MSPRFSASGRPRHGIKPSGAAAKRRAPAMSASASHVGSSPPKTYVHALGVRMAALGPRVQFPRQRTRCTQISGASPAAEQVASARTAPEQRASTRSSAERHVMQTRTEVRSVGSTRAAPVEDHVGVRQLCASTLKPRAVSTVAEAPRPARDSSWMAGFLARGSSRLAAFPIRSPAKDLRISGFGASARRSLLRGQPWLPIHHIPSSLDRSRPSTATSTPSPPRVVNGIRHALRSPRCQVLDCARRAASETGSRCEH